MEKEYKQNVETLDKKIKEVKKKNKDLKEDLELNNYNDNTKLAANFDDRSQLTASMNEITLEISKNNTAADKINDDIEERNKIIKTKKAELADKAKSNKELKHSLEQKRSEILKTEKELQKNM